MCGGSHRAQPTQPTATCGPALQKSTCRRVGLAQAVRARDRETHRKERCTERTATIVTKEKKYLLVHNKLLILALLFLIKNCMHNPISRYFLRFKIKISLTRIEQSQNYNVFDV
jgi:hypothetical protein